MLINKSPKNNTSKTDVCYSILLGLENESGNNYVKLQTVENNYVLYV